MRMKIFCMVVLCTCLFIACEKDNDDYEPVKPPVEEPEEPVEPLSTDDIINFKIGDLNMIVGSNAWNAVAYGNDIVVAVGVGGYVTYSTNNGSSWSAPKKIGVSVNDLMFENGTFLLFCSNIESIATTSDGINFYTKNLGINPVGFGHGGGMFAVCNYNGNVKLSIDGITWDDAGVAGTNMAALAVSEEMIIGFTSGGFKYVTKNKGKKWERDTSSSIYPTKIVRGDGKFILINTRSSNRGIQYIEDGSSIPKSASIDSSKKWIDADFGNGRYVVLSSDGYFSTSLDGIDWSEPAQITDESGNVITVTLNSVCAVH